VVLAEADRAARNVLVAVTKRAVSGAGAVHVLALLASRDGARLVRDEAGVKVLGAATRRIEAAVVASFDVATARVAAARDATARVACAAGARSAAS
jgi:hypothetical protein